MDQIPQSIINSLLGGSLAALGWFARQIRCRPPADIMRTECLKTKSPTSNDGAFRAIIERYFDHGCAMYFVVPPRGLLSPVRALEQP